MGFPSGKFIAGTSNPGKVSMKFGGVGRNISESLGRMGKRPVFVSVVGQDPVGEALTAHLEKAGVDISLVLRTPDHATATYVAIFRKDGDL